MKKLVFTALAAVFMLSSGFFSLEDNLTDQIHEEFYECNYSITLTTQNAIGQTVRITRNYTTQTIGPDDCYGTASLHTSLCRALDRFI